MGVTPGVVVPEVGVAVGGVPVAVGAGVAPPVGVAPVGVAAIAPVVVTVGVGVAEGWTAAPLSFSRAMVV